MQKTEEDIVMVKVQRKTRDRLKLLGKKGDSYEDIISALVDAELPTEEGGQ